MSKTSKVLSISMILLLMLALFASPVSAASLDPASVEPVDFLLDEPITLETSVEVMDESNSPLATTFFVAFARVDILALDGNNNIMGTIATTGPADYNNMFQYVSCQLTRADQDSLYSIGVRSYAIRCYHYHNYGSTLIARNNYTLVANGVLSNPFDFVIPMYKAALCDISLMGYMSTATVNFSA